MLNQIALNDPKHYLKCPNDACRTVVYKYLIVMLDLSVMMTDYKR